MGSCLAKDVLKIANDWLGYEEDGDNWTIFSKVLDECDYYPESKQNISWCASFCNFCVLQACTPEDRSNEEKKWDAYYFLYQSSPNWSCGAREFADYFKDAGAWYDEPKVGDMCFFYVNGKIGHVGIVEDIDSYITTIEGNAGDMVQRKWYSYSDIGGRIAGFGRPRYDEPDETPEPNGEKTVSFVATVTVRTTKDIEEVKAILANSEIVLSDFDEERS